MNSNISFRAAFSCPTRSKPCPLVLPLNSVSSNGWITDLQASTPLALGGARSATTSSTFFNCRALQRSSMSCNGKGKHGGQAPTDLPAFCKVKANSLGMGPVEMQVPHPVPAFVHFLMAANVSAPPKIAFLITVFGTQWQLHTKSSSANFVPSPPSSTGMSPANNCSGVSPPKFGFLAIAASLAKSAMSPMRMPPSNLSPPGVNTNFL
mmetsp:Transcript_87821/g.221051  ORF Transcript_87821/g.221051 Transcript_87821/m.221051 type:complete len:208 (+) Transcript_87821:1060-1683(+)